MPLKRIRGEDGEVTIPAYGAVVARIEGKHGGWWEMEQREADRKSTGLTSYRFRALFTYVNPALLHDQAYPHRFTVRLGGKTFRVQWPGERLALTGRTLMIERGVSLVESDSG